MTRGSDGGHRIGSVGVVGLGTMGAGIAEVFARSGLAVLGVEPTEDALGVGRGHLKASVARAVARGKLSDQESSTILGRVQFSTNLADLSEADLIVEAVPERLELKHDIFRSLDKVAKPSAILATNTSSLSVTDISTATSRPERVLGVHFFNPAPVLRLVEVVHTLVTSAEVVEDVVGLVEKLGKRPVVIGDRAGFIANRLLFGYLNAAIRMYDEGHATGEDIDTAMTRGAGLPMGPLALLDLIGLDTSLDILESMYAESRDPRHVPAPLLRAMVTAGLRGRKGGRGFYSYPSTGPARAEASAPVLGRTPPPATRVGVVGCGGAAAGLEQLCMRAGLQVSTVVIPAEAAAIPANQLAELADCEIVLEAVGGDPERTREVLAALGAACPPGAVLATATDVMPVIEAAVAAGRVGDVVGLHPVVHPRLQLDVHPKKGPDGPDSAQRESGDAVLPEVVLLEVAPSVATDLPALETVLALCDRLDAPVVQCRDRVGRIIDALLMPYLNDAVDMLSTGYASADAVDTAMTLGCGYPCGPATQLDEMGLDVALTRLDRGYDESRDPAYAAAPLLRQLVTVGHLGRSSGRGLRTWS